MNRQYEKCFWTASGELDCSTPPATNLYYQDHSYHVPSTGTMYYTDSRAKLNQNLGYVPRRCGPQTSVQPFRPALTHFNLPRSSQLNSYQNIWSRRTANKSGFVYPSVQPNCASCYASRSPNALIPYGNTPSPYVDSEARYNFGSGLPQTGLLTQPGTMQFGSELSTQFGPEPVSSFGYGSQFQSVDFSNSEQIYGPVQPIAQETQQLGALQLSDPNRDLVQYGAGYGQPLSSQPKPMHTYSLIQYKAPVLIQELGNPDVVDTMQGGIAIWKEHTLRNKLGGIFKRVELHDEKIPNLNPPYIGNVYSWVKMHLKSNIFREILDLFPNVWYDRQKQWLTVRTDTLDNNLATVALICLINRGTISVRQCRQYDLQRKYMLSLNPQSGHFNRYSRSAFVNIIKRCASR